MTLAEKVEQAHALPYLKRAQLVGDIGTIFQTLGDKTERIAAFLPQPSDKAADTRARRPTT